MSCLKLEVSFGSLARYSRGRDHAGQPRDPLGIRDDEPGLFCGVATGTHRTWMKRKMPGNVVIEGESGNKNGAFQKNVQVPCRWFFPSFSV